MGMTVYAPGTAPPAMAGGADEWAAAKAAAAQKALPAPAPAPVGSPQAPPAAAPAKVNPYAEITSWLKQASPETQRFMKSVMDRYDWDDDGNWRDRPPPSPSGAYPNSAPSMLGQAIGSGIRMAALSGAGGGGGSG